MNQMSHTNIGITGLLFLLLLPSWASAQSDAGIGRFVQWSYQDAGTILSGLEGRHLAYAGGFLGGLGMLSIQDQQAVNWTRDRYRGAFGRFLNITNELGGPPVLPVSAGVFGLTLLTNNRTLQDAAFTSIQSIVYTGLIAIGLKSLMGRARPEQRLGMHEFEFFSGYTSFPSGHTATAFALVTPWVLYYPHPITYGLFALSAGTALARMAQDRHWFTDVIAGGTLGFLVGRKLTRIHRSRTSEIVQWMPMIGPNVKGLKLVIHIG